VTHRPLLRASCLLLLGLATASRGATAQLDSAAGARGLVASVPLELVGNRILIRVAIDGSGPLTYVFDTGVSGIIVNTATARRLGITADDTVLRAGYTAPMRVARSRGHTLRVGSVRLDSVTLAITDLHLIERSEGWPLDGIIGWDLVSRYAVRLDFDAGRMEFLDNARSTRDAGSRWLLLELQARALYVRGAATLADGARVAGPLWLDTGNPGTVTFNAPFTRSHGLLRRVPSLCERSSGSAGGARYPVRAVMLRGFALGEHQYGRIPGVAVVPGSGPTSAGRNMGKLGVEILKRFNLLIDVRRRRLFLEPNRFAGEPFRTDCSGLSLVADSTLEKALVREVYDRSPARAAGLEPGDEIVRIDGRSASGLGLAGIRRVLLGEWTDLEVVVLRQGEARSVRLRRSPGSTR